MKVYKAIWEHLKVYKDIRKHIKVNGIYHTNPRKIPASLSLPFPSRSFPLPSLRSLSLAALSPCLRFSPLSPSPFPSRSPSLPLPYRLPSRFPRAVLEVQLHSSVCVPPSFYTSIPPSFYTAALSGLSSIYDPP